MPKYVTDKIHKKCGEVVHLTGLGNLWCNKCWCYINDFDDLMQNNEKYCGQMVKINSIAKKAKIYTLLP